MLPDSPDNREEPMGDHTENVKHQSSKEDAEISDPANASEDNQSNECEESAGDSIEQDPAIEELELRIEQLKAAADEAKDRELRAHAEAENVRRRSAREYEQVRKFALEGFSRELLPALDNFATAIKTAKDQGVDGNVLQGIELSVKTLIDAMSKNGISEFDPIGEVFDPERHMAMTSIEHPDAEPGTVVEVFRKGYLIHDRLLREAEVIVSKAPSADDAEQSSNESEE
ncbi:MAG: nucleotide exchange factor GrpE [Gammaproteobacteria bacterium]|nr:nucleotide exchange factor GrpE [Gammaproteobacteria bacterium]